MVDAGLLTLDVLSNVAALALPAALWFLLFHLAWERPSFARSIGFGRVTFWLLLVGGLVGLFANLPIAAVSDDILAVNIGGGVIPLLLSTWLLGRTLGSPTETIPIFWGFFAVESIALLLVVLLVPAPVLAAILEVGVAAAVPLVLWAVGSAGIYRGDPALLRRIGLFLALVSGAILVTFYTTATIPLTGIVSVFPLYLLAPLGIGLFAVLLVPESLGAAEGKALPIAYAAATFGVLVGADLLRQPPLYVNSPPALYAIGGAGLLDLLYLSGLIAFATAYVVLRWRGHPFPPTEPVVPGLTASPAPAARLRRAFDLGVSGRSGLSVEQSALAAGSAADQARRLTRGRAPAIGEGPWEGLPVPHWVATDQANLDALARSATAEPREAFRAWLTARWLVRLGRRVGQARFASAWTRFFAFAIDLVVVTAPAGLLWLYLAATIPGSFLHVLGTPGFNAAAFGYAAWAFLYFVIAEVAFGRTVGKRALGLAVRTRALGSPGLLPVFLRDTPKLVPLTIIGVGGAVAALVLLRGSSVGTGLPAPLSTTSATVLVFLGIVGSVAVGVLVCAFVGFLVIAATSEHQRLGDLLAGTWVVREPKDGAVPFGAMGEPLRPPGMEPPPPGPGRSA